MVGIYSETGFWTCLAFLFLAMALEAIAKVLKEIEYTLKLHGWVR
jgi:hypothetical protein